MCLWVYGRDGQVKIGMPKHLADQDWTDQSAETGKRGFVLEQPLLLILLNDLYDSLDVLPRGIDRSLHIHPLILLSISK